jgi:hypothetical protein
MSIRPYSRFDHSIEVVGGTIDIPLVGITGRIVGSGTGSPDYDARKWQVGHNYVLQTQADADRWAIEFAVPQLRSGRITQIVATLEAAGGHAGLPTTMPRMVLWRVAASIPGQSGGIDTSASTAAYEAEHTITLVVTTNNGFAAGNRFMLAFEGESDPGANAIVGLELRRLQATIAPDYLA